MGGSESGVGESPSFHPIIGGIPIKKKIMPKKQPKNLTMKKGWEKSFGKLSSGGKKAT